MKGRTVLTVGACVALAALALVAREWLSAMAPDSSNTVERGAGARGAADERGDAESRAAGGTGHAKPGPLAGGGKVGTDRTIGDDSPNGHRAGSSTLVHGAKGLAGSASAGTVGDGSVTANGGDPLHARPDAAKREIPDMPKQAALTNGELAGEFPEAAPEVAYDGGPDHVFSTKSQVQVPDAANITGDAGTISFWLKPEWAPTSQDDATFVQLGDSGLQVVKNVNFLRFEYLDSTGTENGLGTNIGNWPPDQWRQVTATWTNGSLSLYVDGQLISQNHYQYPPTFGQETKLYVGSDFPGTPVAPGQVSNLIVLNRDSAPGEISQQFQSGRPTN